MINHKEHKEHKETAKTTQALSLCSLRSLWLKNGLENLFAPFVTHCG